MGEYRIETIGEGEDLHLMARGTLVEEKSIIKGYVGARGIFLELVVEERAWKQELYFSWVTDVDSCF